MNTNQKTIAISQYNTTKQSFNAKRSRKFHSKKQHLESRFISFTRNPFVYGICYPKSNVIYHNIAFKGDTKIIFLMFPSNTNT